MPLAAKDLAKHFKELSEFLCQETASCSKRRRRFQQEEAERPGNLWQSGQVDVGRWSAFVFKVHRGSQMEGPL